MKAETIKYLKSLINEKQDRLSAIGRRLGVLKLAVNAAETEGELAAIQAELNELKPEASELIKSIDVLKDQVQSFYKRGA